MGITRRQLIQTVGFTAGGLGTVALAQGLQGCRGRKKSPPINTTAFEFEVVTANVRGEEIERRKGKTQFFAEDLGNGVILEMVSIPGGTFMMGSPESEDGRNWHNHLSRNLLSRSTDVEGPQYRVTVPFFFMGKYPVTQAQWKKVTTLPKIKRKLNPNPSHFKGNDHPVEKVSWYDALEFCARLSQKTGREYHLPSEAQWEYACRAGTITPFHFGQSMITDWANYRGTDWKFDGKIYSGSYGDGPKGEFRNETTPVSHFKVANAFGLFDMHGNVNEWCADCWYDNYQGDPTDGSARIEGLSCLFWNRSRVLRGSSWLDVPILCRSAYRIGSHPDNVFYGIGFRIACAA